MNDLSLLGNVIKEKRLALNLRMDDVAKRANITRATLWSIEKGSGNCSMNNLVKVMNVLGLSLSIDGMKNEYLNRNRASRINTSLDKKINRMHFELIRYI